MIVSRWLISVAVLLGVLAGLRTEGVHFYTSLLRRAADRAYYEGDLDGALAKYERARRLLPDDPRSQTDLANTIGQALEGTPVESMSPERIEELAGRAARCYLEAIRSSPPGAWSYAGLGSLSGSLGTARRRKQMTDLNKLSTDPLSILGPEDRLYEAALVKAVQLEPRNYYYRDFLGDFYRRRGFRDRALAHFRFAVRLQPLLDRHYYLGELATVSPAVLSAVEAGIRDALRYADTEVSYYDIHRFLAEVYLRTGRLPKAREELEAAAAVAPLPHIIDIQIGQILVDEGDDEGALEAFRRAAERRPDYHRAWLRLAMTLSRMGRHDEAIDAAMRARSLKPGDFTVSWALARVLSRAGRLDEAVELLENIIRAHPERQQPFLELIDIYEKQKTPNRAIRVARELAAQFPDEPAFQKQLEQLERVRRERP